MKSVSLQTLWPLLKANQGSMCDADTALVILGLTGSGKSTFINAAAGDVGSEKIPVGHGLESSTQRVCAVVINDPTCPSKRVLLVEAPAFTYDIASIRDSERQLTKWIGNSSAAPQRIAGVLYLGNISEPRMTISPFVHLEMLEQLLGKRFNTKVQLVTTMWNRTPRWKAERREEEMKASQWRPLIASGSRYSRFDGTNASALSIIKDMLTDTPETRGQPKMVDIPRGLRSRVLSLFRGAGWTLFGTSPPPRASDEIYVAVIGLSGSGKSSFINAVAGQDVRAVGHGLDPCTKEIGTFEVSCPWKCDSKIVLIDTPGWDDLNCSDTGGIKAMSQQLKAKNGRLALAGIVYLHRIASNRASSGTFREIVKSVQGSHLCGKGVSPLVVAATTMWDEVDREVGNVRHSELEVTISQKILRHTGDYLSAWRILDVIVQEANTRFDECFQSGLKELIACLRSSDPLSIEARRVEVLGQKLAEVVTNLRKPEQSEDKICKYALDYETARGELCIILETLQKGNHGHAIDEYIWKRAKLQIQVATL